MVDVSSEWESAFGGLLVPETFIEIELKTRFDHNGTGTIKSGEKYEILEMSPYCDPTFANIMNQKRELLETAPAVLEYNLWTLDGTRTLLPDDDSYKIPGVIDNASMHQQSSEEELYPGDRYGTEAAYYTYGQPIFIVFNETVTSEIPGVCLTWDNVWDDYASTIRVTVGVWDGTSDITSYTRLTSSSVYGNTDLNTYVGFDDPVSNFNVIEVDPVRWSFPERRAKLCGLTFGYDLTLDKHDLMSYTHTQSGDLACSELSTNTIEFTLDDHEGKWNTLKASSYASLLQEQQKLTVRYGVKLDAGIEWIPGGLFYLSEWGTTANGQEARFKAVDVLHLNREITIPARAYLTAKPYTEDGSLAPIYHDARMEDKYGDGLITGSSGHTLYLHERIVNYYYVTVEDPTDYTSMCYRFNLGKTDTGDSWYIDVDNVDVQQTFDVAPIIPQILGGGVVNEAVKLDYTTGLLVEGYTLTKGDTFNGLWDGTRDAEANSPYHTDVGTQWCTCKFDTTVIPVVETAEFTTVKEFVFWKDDQLVMKSSTQLYSTDVEFDQVAINFSWGYDYIDTNVVVVLGVTDDVKRKVKYRVGYKIETLQTPEFTPSMSGSEFLQYAANKCGYTIWQSADGVINIDEPSQYVAARIERSYEYTVPEVDLAKPLRNVVVIGHWHDDHTIEMIHEVGKRGEDIVVDNPWVWADEKSNVDVIAAPYVDLWEKRTILSGEFRASPNLELFDRINVSTEYGYKTIVLTEIKYTYNGTFRGYFKGHICT